MPASTLGQSPNLTTFLKSPKQSDIETYIELFTSLLKRRQIKNSRPCAIATTHLLLRVVAAARSKDAQTLITRVREVGRRLIAAQPRELAVGNIVRRVLYVIREVVERDEESASEVSATTPTTPISGVQAKRPPLPTKFSEFTPLHGAAMPEDMQTRTQIGAPGDGALQLSSEKPAMPASSTSFAGQGPAMTTLFNILQHPQGRSPLATPPGAQSPNIRSASKNDGGEAAKEKLDIKAEIIDGIKELQDELEIVDSQIAESALDHIHSGEIVLTHTSSQTVQKFLLTAARKRKFTVVHAEAYPNDHQETHATILNGGGGKDGDDDGDERWKPLTSMGITVIMIPDSAVFTLMARINKVVLAPHTVLANGSLLAAAGASTIAQAAKTHRVPVVVLSGVYKLSPVYPFSTEDLIEYGDPAKAVPFEDGKFMDRVDVVNPLYDWVDAELVDLYITNLGACAPSFLYSVVAEHYFMGDIDLNNA